MRQLFLVILLICSQYVSAKTYHALVVGVSEYPNLDPNLSLQGPKFDAIRVQSMLLQQGVAEHNIHLLADGVDGAKLPTMPNILEAFSSLEQSVSKGDFVYLHFSGHGSQQPTTNSEDTSDSIDGLDEIFLPRDVQQWSKSLGAVPNSLSDDQVKVLTTRLRNKGANVWVIFDSCHSGTMTRSLTGQEFRSRNIDLGVLKNTGIAKSAPLDQTDKAIAILKPVELKQDAGALISFGAAQSNEEAPEMTLPNGEQSSPQGLFTYTMTSLISQDPNISYRQLAQGILSVYNSLPWYRTTPLFEGGTQLDKPIFHRDGDVVIRYSVSKKKGNYFIQGGQLNGLEAGAVLEVFSDVSSAAPIALLEIMSSELTTSEGRLQTGEITNKRSYAQLISPAYPESIKFKWQRPPSEIWKKALDSLFADNKLVQRTVEWVNTDQSADISLYVADESLYLFTLSNEVLPCEVMADSKKPCNDGDSAETYFSLSLNTESGDIEPYQVLNNGLSRMVRSHNLKRLSATMTGSSNVLSEVYLNDSPLELDKIIKAKDGDDLYVSFANQGRKPVDLTVMFIDSGLGITQVFPEPGYSGRLFAGESTEFEGTISSEGTTGEEQFVIIAVPANRDSPQMSLSHLQQEPLESRSFFTSTTNKSRGEGGYEDIFAQALGDLPQNRAFKKREKSAGRATISVIRLQTE